MERPGARTRWTESPAKQGARTLGTFRTSGKESSTSSMLRASSPSMLRENNKNEDRLMKLASVAPVSMATSLKGGTTLDMSLVLHEDYDLLADAIMQETELLRQRQTTFEPTSQKLARGRSAADLAERRHQNQHKEGFTERLQAWKYVRRIEPELPPLPSLQSLGPAPQWERAQDKVLMNLSSAALEKYRPQERLESIAAKAVEQRHRQQQVKAQKLERRASRTQAIKDNLRKDRGAEMVVLSPRFEAGGIFQAYGGQRNSWLVVLVVGSVAKGLQDNLLFSRMACSEQHALLEKIGDKAPIMGKLMREVHDIKVTLSSPDVKRGLMLLSCVLAGRRAIKRRQLAARVMTNCLHSWSMAGTLHLRFRRIARGVVLIQVFWRTWQSKLRRIFLRVNHQFVTYEKKVIVRELREEANKSKAPSTLTYENQILFKRVEEKDREHFLVRELRWRRWHLLPKLNQWSSEYRRWLQQVREYKALQECVKFLGGDPGDALPLFLFPPPTPSYAPNEQDIADMLQRCRKHSNNYNPIPQDPRAPLPGTWRDPRRLLR